jgi:hypothetical protein
VHQLQDTELPESAVRQGHHGRRQAGARRGASERGMCVPLNFTIATPLLLFGSLNLDPPNQAISSIYLLLLFLANHIVLSIWVICEYPNMVTCWTCPL